MEDLCTLKMENVSLYTNPKDEMSSVFDKLITQIMIFPNQS